jgi:hypothetical protein
MGHHESKTAEQIAQYNREGRCMDDKEGPCGDRAAVYVTNRKQHCYLCSRHYERIRKDIDPVFYTVVDLRDSISESTTVVSQTEETSLSK